MDPFQRLLAIQRSNPSVRSYVFSPESTVTPGTNKQSATQYQRPAKLPEVPTQALWQQANNGNRQAISKLTHTSLPETVSRPGNPLKDIGDFAAGANQQFLGGAVRSAADVWNLIANGFNADKAKKDTENFLRSTGQIDKTGNAPLSRGADVNSPAFKFGQNVGKAETLATDIMTSLIPGVAVEKVLATGLKAKNLLQGSNTTSNVARNLVPIVTGGAVSSAVSQAQDPTQDANLNIGGNAFLNTLLAAFGPVASATSRAINNTKEGSKYAQKIAKFVDKFMPGARNEENIKDVYNSLPDSDINAIKEAGGDVSKVNQSKNVEDANVPTDTPQQPATPETPVNKPSIEEQLAGISKNVGTRVKPTEGTPYTIQSVDETGKVKIEYDDGYKTETTDLNKVSNDITESNLKVTSEDVRPSPETPPVDTKQITSEKQIEEQAQVQSGTTEAPKDVTPNGDKNVENAKATVLNSLADANTAYDEAAAARSIEKGKRAGGAAEAFQDAGGGSAGVKAKLAALKGEYSKSEFSIQIPAKDMDTLNNHIESNPNLQLFEKTNAQVALMKLNGEIAGGITPSDIKNLKKALGEDFGTAVSDAVEASKTTADKVRSTLGDIAGLPKSLMASMDISGTLRQGGILASRFPKQAAEAFKQELRYFKSEKAFQEGMQEIQSRPSFQKMLDSKLAVTGTEALTAKEEQFISDLAERIPGIGIGVKASDRAYTGYLTKLRADVFDTIVTNETKALGRELTDKEMTSISKFINTASGRGELGPYLESHAQTLSTALFAPRLWKSRLDMLNPVYYAKLDPIGRKYALQSAASFGATASAVLGLAAMAGAQVETDPRSSDFGKIKVGNTRFDIMGGLQQNIVFIAREITGEKKNSETGKITKFAGGLGDIIDPNLSKEEGPLAPNRLSIATDLIQNKENPLFATAQRIIEGKDRGGHPVNPFVELANLVVPLPASGAVTAYNDTGNPLMAVALTAPDLIGISSQTYGTLATKDKGKGPQGQVEYVGKVENDMVTDRNGKVMLDDKGAPVRVKLDNNSTPLEIKALKDKAQQSAYREQFVRQQTKEDQALMKLSKDDLSQYVKDKTIDQAKADHILELQKKAENAYKVKTPQNLVTEYAKNFYQTYNSMTDAQQKKWEQKTDPAAKELADKINKTLVPGLEKIKASNKLLKVYAEFENDIQNHPEYTPVDLQNKKKSFQIDAYKTNYSTDQLDIYSEGGSSDLKALLSRKSISQADLDAAIRLDDQLYASGLTGSLKFSKKFRASHGYGVPAGGGGGGGSSSSFNLASYLPSKSTQNGSPRPEVSAKSRTTKLRFNNVSSPKGTTKKIQIRL